MVCFCDASDETFPVFPHKFLGTSDLPSLHTFLIMPANLLCEETVASSIPLPAELGKQSLLSKPKVTSVVVINVISSGMFGS